MQGMVFQERKERCKQKRREEREERNFPAQRNLAKQLRTRKLKFHTRCSQLVLQLLFSTTEGTHAAKQECLSILTATLLAALFLSL
jgi:hypothetical protein